MFWWLKPFIQDINWVNQIEVSCGIFALQCVSMNIFSVLRNLLHSSIWLSYPRDDLVHTLEMKQSCQGYGILGRNSVRSYTLFCSVVSEASVELWAILHGWWASRILRYCASRHRKDSGPFCMSGMLDGGDQWFLLSWRFKKIVVRYW